MDVRRFQGSASLPPYVKSGCGSRGPILTFLGNESPDAVFRRLQNVALHTTGEVLRELTIPTICMLPPADGPLIK